MEYQSRSLPPTHQKLNLEFLTLLPPFLNGHSNYILQIFVPNASPSLLLILYVQAVCCIRKSINLELDRTGFESFLLN